MIEGVLIFIAGLAGGWAACHFTAPKQAVNKQYQKYKNPDGLYSSKAVKAAKEG